MKLIERISFPTDFGESSDLVLKSVIEIAKKFGSEVNVVHVLPGESLGELVRSYVDKKMSSYIDQLKENGIRCSSDIIMGKHIYELLSFFEKKHANLIILGAGHVGKDKFKLGSNSEKIIRESSVPVWVIDKDSSIIPQKVLCPVDFSEESLLSLENAIQLCRRLESDLHILHAVKEIDVEYTELGADLEQEQQDLLKMREGELDEFINSVDLSGVEWSKEVRQGDPPNVILDTIKEKKIDLLMMGSTGKGAITRMLIGSVTERVSREVPCSFIISKNEALIHLLVDREISDIDAIYQEGVDLAKQGYVAEAIDAWKRCLSMNELYLKAWTAIALAYDNLGDAENADSYRASRDRIQRSIWDKQVEADLRGKHFLFK